MEHITEIARILDALKGIPGLTVTRGWPKDFVRLPCAAVSLASDNAADHRDDARYLTELEFYIRVFGDTNRQVDTVLPQINQAVEGLGYERTFLWEETDGSIRQTVLRYRIVL